MLAASLGSDFIFTPGTRLNFTDIETTQSNSSEELVVPIINNDIAEPCESFICTLQGGALDAVRGIEPNRVTIRICDDDGELMHNILHTIMLQLQYYKIQYVEVS